MARNTTLSKSGLKSGAPLSVTSGAVSGGAARLTFAAIAAILAQIIIAPNIAIFGAVPNVILVTVAIISMRRQLVSATVFGFTVGLIYDLVATGPFGLMTLIMTIISLVISSLNKDTFSGSRLAGLVFVLLSALFGELLYGVILVLINPELDIATFVTGSILPATIYNIFVGAILFTIVTLLSERQASASSAQNLGKRTLSSPMLHSTKVRTSKGSHAKLPGRSINRKLR